MAVQLIKNTKHLFADDEPRKGMTLTLRESTLKKLADLARHKYRGVNAPHAIRCAIEDAWEQWNDEKQQKEAKAPVQGKGKTNYDDLKIDG